MHRSDIFSNLITGAGPIAPTHRRREILVGGCFKSGAALAVVSFAAVACGAAPAGDKDVWTLRLAQIEALSQLCGLPQGALTLGKDDHVLLRGPVDNVPFSAVRCAFEKFEQVGIPRDKIGFVAEPPPEGQN